MGDAFISRRDEGSTFNKMLEITENYISTINASTRDCNISGGLCYNGKITRMYPMSTDYIAAWIEPDEIGLASYYYASGETARNVLYVYGKNVGINTLGVAGETADLTWIREYKVYNKDLVGIVFSTRYNNVYFASKTKLEHGIYYLTLIRNSSTLL